MDTPPQAAPQGNTFVVKVAEKKYLFYGFFLGVGAVWVLTGAKGEYSPYLMLVAVGLYYYTTRKAKKEGKDIFDAIEEIATAARRKGFLLDIEPRFIRVRQPDPAVDRYFIYFMNNHLTFTYEGKLTGGIRELHGRSANSLAEEREDYKLESRRINLKDLTEES